MSKRNNKTNQKNTLNNYFEKNKADHSSETGKLTDSLEFSDFYESCLSTALEENAINDGNANSTGAACEEYQLSSCSSTVRNESVCIVKIMLAVVPSLNILILYSKFSALLLSC